MAGNNDAVNAVEQQEEEDDEEEEAGKENKIPIDNQDMEDLADDKELNEYEADFDEDDEDLQSLDSFYSGK